ncbi:MAG: hypothetical protein ACRCTR_00230 [Actinomycetota bacterium]
MLRPDHQPVTPTRDAPAMMLPRRALLRAGMSATAVTMTMILSGCGVRFGQPTSNTSPTSTNPDTTRRERIAVSANSIAAALDSVAAQKAKSDLKPKIIQLADHHRSHAITLRGNQPVATTTNRPTTESRSLTMETIADMIAATIEPLTTDIADAEPDTAALIASIAASRLQHIDLLTQWATSGKRP